MENKSEEYHTNILEGGFIMRLYHKIAALAASVFLLTSLVNAAMPDGYKGVVFDSLKGIPTQIPGFLNIPYFDKGDTGVTFHYTWSNMGDCHWRDGDPGKKVSLQMFGEGKDLVSGAAGLPDRDPSIPHISDSACYPAGKNAHLGWIQVGEWLNYTVHVNTAGTYKMILHESVVSTSQFTIVTFSGRAPDTVKGFPMSVRPPTDHELCHDYKWDTAAVKVTLDTGLYVVKITLNNEGFNFHGIKFVLDGTPVLQGKNQAPALKGLTVTPVVNGSNLTVSYSLAQAGISKISVFDCAGRSATPAIIRSQNAGSQKETIGLSNLGTGVHFVRVEHNGLREIKSFTVTR
jgi:hypothetical protein